MAKDWCLTIRASQVIPIYPLSEDLEPGDVFLVTTPIQTQAEQYKENGFLPLDMHLVRLDGLDYEKFYRKSYGTTGHADAADFWKFTPGPTPPPDPDNPRHRATTSWSLAPRAPLIPSKASRSL
jgi:hypothetical protein